MKKLRMLKRIFKYTHADSLLLGFVVFFLIDALVIMLVEPEIKTYRDAMWYCYAVFSTAGFGDIVAVTFVGRVASVLLTLYTILIVAIVTGVVVSFYNDMISMKYRASKAQLVDKLEHLEDLSREELSELSERIRRIG